MKTTLRKLLVNAYQAGYKNAWLSFVSQQPYDQDKFVEVVEKLDKSIDERTERYIRDTFGDQEIIITHRVDE